MANSKATKKALFTSLLSLLLCFTMLMGATFAWFTDTVTSANNIIKSGTLDVEMHWADGTEAVPADESADWEDASTYAIFDYKLWEPGYVDVKHVKIENVGTLGLKYQLRIVPTGEVSILADVIDVYYLDPAQAIAGRGDLAGLTKLGTLSDVLGKFNETAQGTLTANVNDTDIVTIALKMQESAGNEYQNKAIGDSFAVELYATQLEAEKDSFDNTYDKNATYEKKDDGTIVVFSKEGLSDIAALASTDESITSVNYNGEEVPVVRDDTATAITDAIASGADTVVMTAGNYKMPSSGTTGTVDFVGTEDTVIDVTMGAYMLSATASFTGVTIKTGTGKANGNGSDYAALYSSNTTYTDCVFEGPMRLGGDGTKFVDCTFNNLGNDYVWNMQWDTSFEGCTFNSDGKALLLYADGSFNCDGTANVTVTGCTFNATTGAKAGAIANQNCAAIEIHNYGTSINLTTSGNTYDSNFSGEWRIKTLENNGKTVKVNGTEYTQIAIDGKLMTIDTDKNVTVQ